MRRREGLLPVIREARRYGAGYVYMHNCYPEYMIRIQKCASCYATAYVDSNDHCHTCYLKLNT